MNERCQNSLFWFHVYSPVSISFLFSQTCGTSCTILEAAKHQDLGIPKTFPFLYQEVESTKQTVGAINKALPEEVWIKVGGKPFIFFSLSFLLVLKSKFFFWICVFSGINMILVSVGGEVFMAEMLYRQHGARFLQKSSTPLSLAILSKLFSTSVLK